MRLSWPGSQPHFVSPCPCPSPPRLLSKILSECEDADEIEYLVDGSWCPIRAEKERSCSPQCPILVLGESLAQAPSCPMACRDPRSGGLVISEFDLCPAMWHFHLNTVTPPLTGVRGSVD